MSSHKFELLDEEVEGVMDQVTDKLQVSRWKAHLTPPLIVVQFFLHQNRGHDII